MRHCEITKNLLPELQLPAITGTSPTPSGRQLIKTAILFTDRNGWLTAKHATIPLDTTGFT